MTSQDLDSRPEGPQRDTGTGPAVHDGRRRLLRGGLATGPLLLTVVSRPAMANFCVTASANSSMSSNAVVAPMTCSGMSPTSWSQPSAFPDWPKVAVPGPVAAAAPSEPAPSSKTSTSTGPSTLTDAAPTTDDKAAGKVQPTTFNSVFGNAGGYGGKKTLVEILALNTSMGRDGLACHLVAAYLNALKGYTPAAVLDVPTVKNIWASFVARGYYEPTAGIKWYPDYAEPANPRGGLIAWLKTTMPR